MLAITLFSLALPIATAATPREVFFYVEATPTSARVGDVLFVRATVENRGKEPVMAPSACPWQTATLRLELYDAEEHTGYHFEPDGGGLGYSGRDIRLDAGQKRIVELCMVRMPRLDHVYVRFWNPSSWKAGRYTLVAQCDKWRETVADIRIASRAPEELATLVEFYQGGPQVQVPDRWNPYERYWPHVGMFGLLSFPPQCSIPANLAVLERSLSEGSLRDLVHATRLTQDVYYAQDIETKRQAAARLFAWLDARHEIQRQYMARQLVGWGMGNNGLGKYQFEFVDQIIPRLPEHFRGQNYRENYRRDNDAYRRAYEASTERTGR